MSAFLLPHLLTGSAERVPERTAAVDSDGSVTYADLDARSTRLAHVLRDAGVRPGDRVGLYLPKSIDAIAGLYGIMKAGAAYVPLDPVAPAARLAYIMRNCDIRALITAREKSVSWEALLAAGAPLQTVVVADAQTDEVQAPAGIVSFGQDAVASAPAGLCPINRIDLDLAYILYTSGSTGQPKGVMLSHLNALTFVQWCYRYFQATPADVFSNHAPLHFDLTILDLFVAAMGGAAVVVVPPETSVFAVQLARFIEHHRITIWYSVPSVLTMLVLHGSLSPGRLPNLREVIFAGEVFPTKHLRQFMALVPSARFTNLYGPTETNVCTYYSVPPLPEGQTQPIPIGRAIENVEVFALTEDGRRAAPGEVGELYVRGSTTSYGYWGDPERTARAFVTNPLGPTLDQAYRTGDLVQETEDGDYMFLGRRDHQIKSRGYRIELGDVEAGVYAHPAVEECAVIPLPDEVLGNRILAFVVLRDGGVSEAELAAFCAKRLPRYMIPEKFAVLSQLPKTSTGKVDRAALTSGAAARA